jgi:hypothetical protein
MSFDFMRRMENLSARLRNFEAASPVAPSIFRKKCFDLDDCLAVVDVPRAAATEAQVKMMEARMGKFTEALAMADRCLNPWEVVEGLTKDKEDLEDLVELGWMSEGEIVAENEALKQKIEELEQEIKQLKE